MFETVNISKQKRFFPVWCWENKRNQVYKDMYILAAKSKLFLGVKFVNYAIVVVRVMKFVD